MRASLRFLLSVWVLSAGGFFCAQTGLAGDIGLALGPRQLRLQAGPQAWQFDRVDGRWFWSGVAVKGKVVVRPVSPDNTFWMGSGGASSYEVLTNSSAEKVVRFLLGQGSITYRVRSTDPLPMVQIEVGRTNETICLFSTESTAAQEHGAWVTRGWVATDEDGSEAFIDGSNPWVFGHSSVGALDVAYALLPRVNGHIQPNGRTEQQSETFFKAERRPEAGGQLRAVWQLRLGATEPKAFAAIFDVGLGGRVSDVCEKYFAGAVDMLVDLTQVPRGSFSPEQCMEMMPVRLAAPDAFIPGWGLMMDEFPNASYPFAHDSVWQAPALLAYEGLATGRDWERNFARYFLDKTPLEGPDGKSFFVRRAGGLTRWGYFATYREGFVPLDGGTWWQADILYQTARVLSDGTLRKAALDMVLHDLNVKLNLEKMTYPPCWSATLNRVGDDHRDDWFRTPGLAYCAYMAATVAYPETKDPKYLAIADKITDWFASYIVPEAKLNNLQGNNMHAAFSHYLTLAFLERYDRSQERRFLDMARDMAWVHIMTTCTTAAKDNAGNQLTGTTCVGMRGCVDYDCSPNLCQEKDLTFISMIGPLLDHVSGPGYAKYLALCRLVLDKDSWKSAWKMELRDTNLRTMYDTYARGMANLAYALDPASDPGSGTLETLVSKSATTIRQARDCIAYNGTDQPRKTKVKLPFLRAGSYQVRLDGKELGRKTHDELARGIELSLPANSMQAVHVRLVRPEPERPQRPNRFDSSVTWLSDLQPLAAQRGTGFPEPIYRKDRSFDELPIDVGQGARQKGLGCAANTVLVYPLNRNFERFRSTLGVDRSVAGKAHPRPSVFFTVFVDGKLRFESGSMFAETPPREVDVDIRGAQTLMLRVSCNWDDNGNSENDHGDWADARLTGKRPETAETHKPLPQNFRSQVRGSAPPAFQPGAG